MLTSCDAIYYAQAKREKESLVVALSEFEKEGKNTSRKFVLVKAEEQAFPICIYKTKEEYHASLLKCTHRGCELNVGGGMFTCPCHGSEFTVKGEVLEGPATQNLQMFKTRINNDNLYVEL